MTLQAAPPDRAGGITLVASVMALSAGIIWSLGALTARLARHTDAWQYLIWRSIGIIVVIEALALRTRLVGTAPVGSGLRRAYTSGYVMLVACACLLLASLGFVYALKNTTAANAAFLSSLTPLMAVVLARVVLGERLTLVTVGAIAFAFAGLAIMVTADLGVGNMKGNISAVLSSVGFAGYTVCVRTRPDRDWSPVLPGYASMLIVLCVAVCAADGRTVVPPVVDIGWAMLHGGVIIVVGTLLFNAGSRHLPAVAMTVFAQTETVFVPIWIFVRFDERPKSTTLLGGVVILSAVLGKALIDARLASRARPAAT